MKKNHKLTTKERIIIGVATILEGFGWLFSSKRISGYGNKLQDKVVSKYVDFTCDWLIGNQDFTLYEDI